MSTAFNDEIRKLTERANRVKDNLQTEEAAKTALVLPFIQTLGYDIFDPTEVVPEFDADMAARYGSKIEGVKKAEKIDYVILKDAKPIILFECKKVNAKPADHFSQLARYFHALDARFAVLTTGIEYEFFTDLESPNRLDSEPFLKINLLEFRDAYFSELIKFHKSSFNVENIISTANELKYTTAIKSYLRNEFESPSENFISFLLKQEKIYSGRATQKIVEQFTPFVKNAITQLISDQISERLRNALVRENLVGVDAKPTPVVVETPIEESAESKIVTTPDELEAFYIVKSILRRLFDSNRICFRDAQSYFTVIIDDNNRKPVCRLRFSDSKRSIGIIDESKKEVTYVLESLDDIYLHADTLLENARRYV